MTPDAAASSSEAVTLQTPPELPVRKPTRARRLKTWLSSPPWWVQNIFVALLVGGIVAVVSILWQKSISELENLRFVRQLSSEPGIVARPFSGIDLQGQNLAGLDLTGASLDHANLQHANLALADLSPGPATRATTPTRHSDLRFANLTGADLYGAHLTGANLTGANLTGANLTGADLTGIYYDEKTKWPVGFKPPPPGKP